MARSILHVAQPTTGGVAHYLSPLVADQIARGWEVVLASPEDGWLAASALASGARHLPWPATRSPYRGVGTELRHLDACIKAARPEVVHLHSSKAGLVGRLLLRRRLPTVFQPHGWSWLAGADVVTRQASTRWERAATRWTDALLCVSEAERRLGEQAGLRARWEVARTGVTLEDFPVVDDTARREARERLRLDHAPLAVCVGRLTRAKGQDLLVRGWPAVRAACPDARLAIVGDGELPGVSDEPDQGIRLAGPSSSVADWYAAADVVVVPSRWDALSLTLVEAAASGCCIVATDAPGAREVLGDAGDGSDGPLVPVGDVTALSAAVTRRLSDPTLAAAERLVSARGRTAWDRSVADDRIAALVDRLATPAGRRGVSDR